MARRTVIELSAADWTGVRFARSVTFEVNAAVRALIDPRAQINHTAWLKMLDARRIASRLPLLIALNPRIGWVPDFLGTAPEPGDSSIESELVRIGAYPPEAAAAQVRRSMSSSPSRARVEFLRPFADDPAQALQVAVRELRVAWTELVEPFFAPVNDLVEADIVYRGRRIARRGLDRAIAELHPQLSTDGDRIVLAGGDGGTVAARGLLFMPSAFVWPDPLVVDDPAWPSTIVYPARGVGELWSGPAPAPTALAGVLGATRAVLLADLAEPATTSALARRHSLAPATVSVQLGRLRDAGLVRSARSGREVLYQRTSAADAVVRAAATHF